MRAAETNAELVELVKYRADSYLGGGARDGRVLGAMREIDRADFVPPGGRWEAYFDEPLPIGRGQTCSQPSMVAFMLDKLEIREGDRVLEIGAGCGYAAAIAAILCGSEGHVLAYELLPELASVARANCAAAGPRYGAPLIDRITFAAGDGSAGCPERAPFDRVLVSAGVCRPGFSEKILLDQLAPGGILVYPEARGNLYRLQKLPDGGVGRDRWGGVAFVELKGRNA